ncbi:PUMILIO-like protein 7 CHLOROPLASTIC-RELATED [Salix purpurea]|uniref:PUMILIO-like protein 7 CHLOROPLASTIC-RELATED n=1 Tax=Salix purpurea TaxID=77065 RepID=A0A9Q0PCK4_SALPP|nr:PUMILIO-like protein 7 CHLOROPLASTIC-RELATED [Salix purpurea]
MRRREEELLNGGGLDGSYLRLLHKKSLFSGSPLSDTSLSLQSSPEFSPSSSFSNGFCSSEDASGSPYATAPPLSPHLFEEAKCHQSPGYLYFNGPSMDDSKSPRNINALSQDFVRMNIREEQNGGAKMKGFEMDPHGDGFGFGDVGVDGSLGAGIVPYNVKRHGSYGGLNNRDYTNGGLDLESFQSSTHGVSLSCNDVMRCRFNGFEKGGFDSAESFVAHNHQSDDLCSGSSWFNNQSDYFLEQSKKQGKWSNEGAHQSQNPFNTTPFINDALVGPQRYKMDSNGGRVVMDSLSYSLLNGPDRLGKNLLLKGRTISSTRNGVPQSLMSMRGAGDMESLSCEDSFILQGRGLNHAGHREHESLRDHKKNHFNEIAVQNMQGRSIKPDDCSLHEGIRENGRRLGSYTPLPMAPSLTSLNDFRGYVYLLAQDQNGCLFLQKIFEEGTSQDIELIFDEIINHIVELMLNPFGNYVVQKLLDVCDENHRLLIVRMVTNEPGMLVRVCLNTYGTRVVQRLIETLTTRQQISLVILALKPGVLDLVKDQNGNHVIQRCLNLLSNEDNKFIFDAATKFCVEIATHRHGCCVMQRCIAHASGKHWDKLMTAISRNGLLLAQDPFGNYVVQCIMDLKNPCSIAILLSQFKGNYEHLSMQKFGSHVVEKCLRHFEESRSQIVLELLSVPHFEQLLQDPFANYVIQCALAVTKGVLHSSLVEAVRPHSTLRTSPYCKRIFSRNLLKK